jgi:hypothetical protein
VRRPSLSRQSPWLPLHPSPSLLPHQLRTTSLRQSQLRHPPPSRQLPLLPLHPSPSQLHRLLPSR